MHHRVRRLHDTSQRRLHYDPLCTFDKTEDVVPSSAVKPNECVLSSNRISSKLNAVGRVSIKTVALIVPTRIPM